MGSDAEGNWMLYLIEITSNLELVQKIYLNMFKKNSEYNTMEIC